MLVLCCIDGIMPSAWRHSKETLKLIVDTATFHSEFELRSKLEECFGVGLNCKQIDVVGRGRSECLDDAVGLAEHPLAESIPDGGSCNTASAEFTADVFGGHS